LKCVICDRPSNEEYCLFHKKAYTNVIQKFDEWQKATGVGLKQYLNAVVANSYTGAWAKEVAVHLLKNKDGKNIV
jgi:hypothetical protein